MAKRKLTLGKWIINKVDTPDYRAGKVTGVKHPKVDQEMIDAIGYRELLQQARELEDARIIKVKWNSVKTDLEKIDFPVDKMPELCKREGVEDPKENLRTARDILISWRTQTTCEWLLAYYDELLFATERGSIPAITGDEDMFRCLNAIADLQEDIWERKFSSDTLHNSKLFKEKYRNRIITILRNKSPKSIDEMTDDEILAQHGIMTYSQTMDVKGKLICTDTRMNQIDTSLWKYGTVLNAQTLTNYNPTSISGIEKVITIENKANYESMNYDSTILYIYTHGFFSPKEQQFLKKLYEVADTSVEFYHWSDMDYGGLRIFSHIKKNMFSTLRPLHMNRAEFEAAIAGGSGIPIGKEKLEKVKAIEVSELVELKQCILEYQMEIEQESLL